MSSSSLTAGSQTPDADMLTRLDKAIGRICGMPFALPAKLESRLKMATEVFADTLGCTRASLWQLNNSSSKFSCIDCFDAVRLRHTADLILPQADHPMLFNSLEARVLEIRRGRSLGPLSREFDAYMELHGLGTLLVLPLRFGDHPTLLLFFEHADAERTWVEEERHAGAILGAFASRLLAEHSQAARSEVDTEARQQLDQVVDFLPDPAFIIDPSGSVMAWNDAIERMTGISKDLIIGHGGQLHGIAFYGTPRPMLADLALRHQAGAEAHYENYSEVGDTVTGEAHVPGLNGGNGATLLGSARPLYDRDGNVIGAIECIRDVTQLRRAERDARDWKRRYEMVSAASGQITYELELDTGKMLWSGTAGFVLGIQLDESAPTYEEWLRHICEEDREAVHRVCVESEANGTPISIEYRIRTPGGVVWIKDHAYVTTDHAERRVRLGMIIDITEARNAQEQLRRAHDELELRVAERTSELAATNHRLLDEIARRAQAQTALASSEEKYRTMVNALPQVVFELDLSGRIIHLNHQGYEISGIKPEQLAQGVSLIDVVHPDDRDAVKQSWARLLAGETVSGNEYRFIRNDGSFLVASSYSRMVSFEGVPAFITGFLIDETPRIKAREALERAHAELELRVEERTRELAEKNTAMRKLLERQEINIGLASRVLELVNSEPVRNLRLSGGTNLFVAAHSMPKHKEGGDHFFTRTLGSGADRRTLISLKDQSGHEVGCILRSIITDMFHNALLAQTSPRLTLPEVMTSLNRELCNSHLFADGEYLTAATLEIEHATLRLHYLLAGHPPFLIARGTQVISLPGADRVGANLPLGMIEGVAFAQGEFQLEPGDRILLYTDGLLDLPTIDGLPALTAGDLAERTRTLLPLCTNLPGVRLGQDLLTLLGCTPATDQGRTSKLPDDLTLVIVELEPESPNAEVRVRAQDVHELSHQRSELLKGIEAEAARAGMNIDRMRLSLVMEEALCNAWKHGCRESGEKEITVRYSCRNDLQVEILDPGRGFDPDGVPDPTAPENRTKPSGRGLFMIRRFADQASWTEQGRHLLLGFAPGPCFKPQRQHPAGSYFKLWK